MPAVTLTKGLTRKCCDCGIALYPQEVSASFVGGRLVDYLRHKSWYVDDENEICFCQGCWERILETLMTDHGTAIVRRKLLERDTPHQEINTDGAVETYLEENPFGLDLPDGTGAGM